MRTEQKFGTSVKAIVAGIALVSGLLASAIPAGAATTAPDLSTMDRSIIGSGSDTTYDLMMALDKVYAAANGCATIYASSASQPKNGQCDTADTAAGNGPDKSAYPWVNDSHAVIKELYPVGSGSGQSELCSQSSTNVRGVDFARSSSGPASGSSAEKCSDLKYIAYAEDAVTWYHFTKNPDGTDTASSRIVSIDSTTLGKIFQQKVTLWSELNGNAGVLDANGNPFAVASSSATPSPSASATDAPLADPLPATGIVLYSAQTGSGTYKLFTDSSHTNSTSKMGSPNVSPSPSQSAAAVYTTNQENYPSAIAQDKNTNNAIYFMSVGRYKQLAGITDQDNAYSSLTATGSHNAGGYADALGQIDGKEPTIANITKGADKTTGYFPYSRNVYNITRYASTATNAYVGPNGFLCKSTNDTKDRIKQIGYRSLIESAIKAEGFAPLPVSGGSYCRVLAANTSVTADDATAPTITLAAPSPSANASGAATFTISFNEPVRATDASKLTVTQSGNSSIAFTTSASSSKGATVSAFDSGNTNDLDPYANKVISNLVVNVTGIAYDADGTHPVTVSLAAGAVADRAGNSSAAKSFTTASNTTAPDLASPSASASASSNASGVATFTVNFSRGVRLTDASALTASQSGNNTLVVAYSAKNANGAPVSLFADSTNTNANDPNGVRLVKTATVTVSGVAYGSPVSINFAAGAGTATNATTTPELNFSVDSNTTAPVVDTEAPTVSDNGSTYKSGSTLSPGSFKLTFSEPVRNIDLTKFSYVSNTATGPVAIATPAAVYTCKTATGRSVACNSDTNNNDDNPSASLAVKTMDIYLGKTPVQNASLFIAAGAFNDKAGNYNVAYVHKTSLVANNLVVVGTWATSGTDLVSSKSNDSRTYGIWGNSVNVVLAKAALGGKVSLKIDGVEYAVDPATITGSQISWDLNGSGNATVALTGLTLGWHTVAIKNLGKSPTATGTTTVQNTFVKVTVKSVS
jgi:ABC-type phosphate transport system substrate-binding protein